MAVEKIGTNAAATVGTATNPERPLAMSEKYSLVAHLVAQLGIPPERAEAYVNGLYLALGPKDQPGRMIEYLRFKIEQRTSGRQRE